MGELIEYQLEDFPDDMISGKQAELNDAYDAFTAKNGLINNRANGQAFSDDSSYYLRVLRKMWTRTATEKQSQICSPSEPLNRNAE